MNAQQERDAIYSLMAYTMVLNDFQTNYGLDDSRGFNIGSVLVKDNHGVVCHGLNRINQTKNQTQHGEVAAITDHLEKTKIFDLKGHTLYTTLEPCVMCAGMMIMTELPRTVFGQKEKGISADDTRNFGGALPRLQSTCNHHLPYPRETIAEFADIPLAQELAQAHDEFRKTHKQYRVEIFLASDAAKAIFQKARDLFLNYPVSFPENSPLHQQATEYYQQHKIQAQ